ncbi:MAG: carbohydrate kinase family protein [Methanobacterium sp.]|nr:carbohydrate kinase family protein [Methanobacterium sp.]
MEFENRINPTPEVAVLGACNIDFIMKVPRFCEADDEVDVDKLKVSLGGSASNFAVGISRMGVDVGIMARIGYDNFGNLAQEKFQKEGVRTERLIKIPESTGMAFISVDKIGERSIYASMGANAKFKVENEDLEYIKGSKLLHVTGMYKEIVEEVAKKANILSINPGTVLSSYGLDTLHKIIKRAHIIFLNKKEVTLLTGEDFKEGAKLLLDMGVPMVVVTCGKHGANLYTSQGVVHSTTSKIEALDTTGAGDAFAAGFIASYIKNLDMKKCLEMGNKLASHCVGKLGAINVPKMDDLDI